MENQDELIQEFINYLVSSRVTNFSSYYNNKKVTSGQWHEIIKIALENGYIKQSTSNSNFQILPKGESLKGNGYLNLIKSKNIAELKQKKEAEQRQKKQDDKLELDLITAKRQVKWFYPLLFISFIGCLGTIIGIVRSNSQKKQIESINKSISHFYLKEKQDSINASINAGLKK